MIIEPRIRGFICTTAHPLGCAKNIENQITYVKKQKPVLGGPKKVLVVGSSTGYGLASRIVAAFGGSQAATVGVFFEKPADGQRTASAGWYNSAAFEQFATRAGLYCRSVNGDAFSDEVKDKVCDIIKKDLGQVDMVVYSLASPRRQNPRTGQLAKSVLKPIGQSYTNKTIDMSNNKMSTITIDPATPDEVDQTISVMGGEDWEWWIEKLQSQNLLKEGALTVAYSYIGPELTRSIYRNGTIGRAKDHLEATAKKLDKKLQSINGRALVSVNKALVTQSSSAIPFIPLYFILLSKVMKEKNVDEDCIAQIYRLFASRLYDGKPIPVDEHGLVRLDDLEMRPDIQAIVQQNWDKLTSDNLEQLSDLQGYHEDFLNLFGFGLPGVNYNADVNPEVPIPNSVS
jgi:enoyl-[acyl-carrier protein] reductase/trans-2-enoyl-CoA reductase (NAD+)